MSAFAEYVKAVVAPPRQAELTFSASFRRKLVDWGDRWGDNCAVSRFLLEGCTHTEFGNYLSLRDGMISYTPAGKVAELEDHGREWKKKDRQTGKPAKIARAVLLPQYARQLTDAQFEKFANLVKSTDPNSIGTLELVQGEAIRHWYLADNVRRGAYASCMGYERCQNWFGIYEQNSNCFMVVVHKDGLASGRALVWQTRDHGMVLDRIYADNATREMIQAHADDQGWKSVMRDYGLTMTVDLEKTQFKAYPYIDSFRYVDHKRKVLTNRPDAIGYDQSLGYNDGGPHVNFSCRNCRQVFAEDDLTLLDDHGAFCEACLQVIYCRSCGEYIEPGQRNHRHPGYCETCIAERTCECGRVSNAPLTDELGLGPLCADCTAQGVEGVATLRWERVERERLRQEALAAEQRRLAEERARYEEEQRRQRAEQDAFYAEQAQLAAAWNVLDNANWRDFTNYLDTGPQVLRLAYNRIPYAVERAFREHPAADYAHLSFADLRRLMQKARQRHQRQRYDWAVPGWQRHLLADRDVRTWLDGELERTRAMDARVKIKVTEE